MSLHRCRNDTGWCSAASAAISYQMTVKLQKLVSNLISLILWSGGLFRLSTPTMVRTNQPEDQSSTIFRTQRTCNNSWKNWDILAISSRNSSSFTFPGLFPLFSVSVFFHFWRHSVGFGAPSFSKIPHWNDTYLFSFNSFHCHLPLHVDINSSSQMILNLRLGLDCWASSWWGASIVGYYI